MSTTLLSPPKTTLDAADLKKIRAIAEATAKSGEPIFLVRGPETADLLKDLVDTSSWSKLQRLGTVRPLRAAAEATKGAALQAGGTGARATKVIEMRFDRSSEPLFEGGIPVGKYEIETMRVEGQDDWKHTGSRDDVSWAEMERLRFMSEGLHRMTDREVVEDERRKNTARARLKEAELVSPEERMAAAFEKALGKMATAKGSAK